MQTMKATAEKRVHFQPTLAPGDAAALEKQIAAHPLLRGMKPQHGKVLAACAMLVQFKEGELIFRECDPANRFYLLEEGPVRRVAGRDRRGRMCYQRRFSNPL